jgi:omega-6 fatty acid desaturase (delta-12 desaturase)
MHPPTVHAQFVEDEGSVVFFKNAYGLAATRPFFTDSSDSGIEVEK